MVIKAYCEVVDDLRGALADWDQASGDGDFGDNLAEGLHMALVTIPARSSVGEEFQLAGAAFLDHVGGTSGPLIGLLFDGIARAVAGGDAPQDESIWRGLREGLDAVQRVGGAKVGDRTMVDVLAPVLAEQSNSQEPIDWSRAVESAWAAARHTSGLLAHRGRASYVGARALGTPDPGAVAIALLFWVLAVELGKGRDRPIDLPRLVAQLHAHADTTGRSGS